MLSSDSSITLQVSQHCFTLSKFHTYQMLFHNCSLFHSGSIHILVHALLLLWWDILSRSTVVVARGSEEVKVVWLQNKTFNNSN